MAYGPYLYRAKSRYGNACEDTLGFSRGGDSSPITLSLTGDRMQGAKSVQVEVGGPSGQGCNCGNLFFYDQYVEFETSQFRYVHVWVKPVASCQWLSFHVWDVTHGDWKTMTGSKDGDETYEAGEDFVAGQWNEVWVDLNQNNKNWANSRVRTFHIHADTFSTWRFDGIYTVSQPWQTFYYHCDYLGSPRLMTDASGNVVWRQDYYAFGSDYGGTATGNTHKFTGHVQDGATGQYYAKARYFTTQLGRWSQPEPLLKGVPGKSFLYNPQKLNPYVYCANNPTKYIDPNGLDVIVPDKLMKSVVNDAYKKSATFRAKYDALRRDKNVLVVITSGKIDNKNEYGYTGVPDKIPNSTAYQKEILIVIDNFKSGKAGTTGHELQHANEIAGLKNNEELNQYKEKTKANGDCTPEAKEVGSRVTNEMLNDADDLKTKEDVTKVYRLVEEEAK